MKLSEKFKDGFNYINKIAWIGIIPFLLDITQLFTYQSIYQTEYNPIFTMTYKIGVISAPPSIGYLFEDFPSPFIQYSNLGFRGILNELNLFNVLLAITLLLIISFIKSGYLSILSLSQQDKPKLKDFFVLGNQRWGKFLLLQIIVMAPFFLMFMRKGLAYLSIVNVIFFYVQYSFVTEEKSMGDHFLTAVTFFFEHLKLTIKMAFYFGFIFFLVRIFIYPLIQIGITGFIISIIAVAYFGALVNRAVLETYREVQLSENEETA